MRFGYVELLATSGFFGSVDGSFLSPFLGSSIRELPDSITGSFQTISSNVILTNIQKKEHNCKPKILITVLFSTIWSIVILHDYSTMLDSRLKCTFEFTVMLLRSANSNKKVIYMVSERFARKFRFIVEEDQMNHVAVQIIEDQQLNDLSRIISTPVSQLFDCKEYRVWNNNFSNDSVLKKSDLNAEEASAMVNEYGPRFVESVVILIDDCAELSKVGHQGKAVALIRRKTRFGKDYFEMTVRFGYVELLAVSGFFGSVDGSFFSPFLGSSIRELPVSITESFQTISTDVIFTTIKQKEHQRKPRILNQYYKRHSTNHWGFYSKKFEDSSFSPANPLSFQNQNLMDTAASLVLKSFAYQEFQEKETDELLPKILAKDEKSLSSVNKLIKKYLVLLNQHQGSFFSLCPPKEAKKELIDIYNASLAGALKSSNIKQIKVAKKRHEVAGK